MRASRWTPPPRTGEDGDMSDDIEKLLAQVSQTTPSTSASPAKKAGSDVAKKGDGKPGGRFAFAFITALVFGGVAFVVGWLFTPFVLTGTSMGVGAALGSFATALLAGPPRWFSS
jgi:hypothetical protein